MSNSELKRVTHGFYVLIKTLDVHQELDVITPSVAYRYKVNKFNRYVENNSYKNRQKSLKSVYKKIIEHYTDNGFSLIKERIDSIDLKKNYDNKFLYIHIEIQENEIHNKVYWDCSMYDSEQKIF